MTVPVVAAALLFWVCVFWIYFTATGTTPAEFFFGRYEPPPSDLGIWKPHGLDAKAGLLREERCLLADGQQSARHLLRQVRYRDPQTGAIVHVEPEQRVRRRRISARAP